MREQWKPRSLLIIAWPWWVLLILLGMLIVRQHLNDWALWSEYLHGFTVLVLDMLLPALPYMVVGCITSTIIATFLTDTHLRHILCHDGLGGMLKASLMGIAFPVSGGDAPRIAERMLQQGCSKRVVTAFLLAAPVVNPIVIASTWQAFGQSGEAALLRGLCAWLLALFCADLLQRICPQADPLQRLSFYRRPVGLGPQRWSRASEQHPNILDTLQQACDRLFDAGYWMIIGAFLVSIWRTLLPATRQLHIVPYSFLTIPLLMGIGWMLSLPAEGDAFVTWALVGQVAGPSLLAWQLVGPVLNRRSLSIMVSRFGQQFVRCLFALGSGIVLLTAVIASVFVTGTGHLMRPSPSLLAATTIGTPARNIPIDNLLHSGKLQINSKNFSEAMEALWTAGERAAGLPVEMVGFVHSDPSLGNEDFVLARQLVLGSSADTVIAGLMCRWPKRYELGEGQWVQVHGRIDLLPYYDLGCHMTSVMPFIQAEHVTLTNPPEEPYVYP